MLLLLACTAPSEKEGVPPPVSASLSEDCEALKPAEGGTSMKPGDDLTAIVAAAVAGDLLVLEAGSYSLSAPIHLDKKGLTLRSRSGDPASVILDGFYASSSIVDISASDVTLAGVTLTRSYGPALRVSGGEGENSDDVRLYDLIIADAGEEGVRIEPGTDSWADGGILACSQVTRSRQGREDPSSTCSGGIDAVGARGWRLYGNQIYGFWCGDWPWALRFRDGSGGTVIERNGIYDSSRLVAFGDDEGPLSSAREVSDSDCPEGVEIEHDGGFLRNNFLGLPSAELSEDLRTGIGIYNSCKLSILHNTYRSVPMPTTILETFGSQSSGRLINGLWPDEPFPAVGTFSMTHNMVPQSSDFVGETDLHLNDQSPARDAGAVLEEGACDQDFDRDPRDSFPDVGADEH